MSRGVRNVFDDCGHLFDPCVSALMPELGAAAIQVSSVVGIVHVETKGLCVVAYTHEYTFLQKAESRLVVASTLVWL